jgi:septum formation protein
MLPLVLGSSSKFRQQILSSHGYTFTVKKPEIDEKAVGGEYRLTNDANTLVVEISRAKSLALDVSCPGCILITCDQVVRHAGVIREKPVSKEECAKYLRSYETEPAETVSGLYVLNTVTGKSACGVDVAKQYFKHIPDKVIDVAVEGDCMYCCGGFMIDDRTLNLLSFV